MHFVQERKLLIRAVDVPAALAAIEELTATGMSRAHAAELVYSERGSPGVREAAAAVSRMCD